MQHCVPIVQKDLRTKHARMKEDALQFLRGTYYRWAQVWPEVCAECIDAPTVLGVGDLHIDSFGTWRDAEGRLCWGVDDFDEAWPLPYTNDLVRLAASTKIAKKLGLLDLKTKRACEVILTAYRRTRENGGCPIVLAEQQRHLEQLGIAALKAPKNFWEKLNVCPTTSHRLPHDAKNAVEQTLPNGMRQYRVIQREAGLGSLGQQRFAAIAECRGGYIAREAKRLVPAANMWLNSRTGKKKSYYEKAMSSAIRSCDPYQVALKSWLIRRLSPDSNPIYIEELSGKRDEEMLLQAMGTEIANVHLGQCRGAKAILKNLRGRKGQWLSAAARKMAKMVIRDWKDYRE
jgi:hypothetical protein